jgi:Tfp pilus assembly protein PilN
LGLTVFHINRTVAAEALLVEKEAKLKALEAKVSAVKELEQLRDKVKAHLDALIALESARTVYIDFMQKLTATMPDALWFESVSTTAGSGPGEQSCCGKFLFTVASAARTGESSADWISKLEKMSGISNLAVSAIAITKEDATAAVAYKFRVQGNYAVPVEGK